jgi:hypothetical protein
MKGVKVFKMNGEEYQVKKSDKFFRCDNKEVCYHLSNIIDDMIDEEINELVAYKAIKDKISGYAWCSELCDSVIYGTCGNRCINYVPRNGKSGCCCNYKSTYDVGEKVIITLNSKL